MLHPESLVWIPEKRVWGYIVGAMGAYYSTVCYITSGIEFEVLMENDEFVLMEDLIEYDAD